MSSELDSCKQIHASREYSTFVLDDAFVPFKLLDRLEKPFIPFNLFTP
jgi:hypothetical protein